MLVSQEVLARSVSVAVVVADDVNNLRQAGNKGISDRDKKKKSEMQETLC